MYYVLLFVNSPLRVCINMMTIGLSILYYITLYIFLVKYLSRFIIIIILLLIKQYSVYLDLDAAYHIIYIYIYIYLYIHIHIHSAAH